MAHDTVPPIARRSVTQQHRKENGTLIQHSRSRVRALCTGGAAIVLAVALTGCSAINVFGNVGEPERDADSQEYTSSGQADVFSIKVGDCLNETLGASVAEVPVVPCGDPHDQEVYAEFALPDGEWPRRDSISELTVDRCDADFRTFVGVRWDDSELDWYPLTPTEEGWNTIGDRLVQCVIYDPAGQVTGSLQAAGR